MFVSLGTVFNKNISHYLKIIEAFKHFDSEDSEYKQGSVRLANLNVVVSTGNNQHAYDQLLSHMKNDQSYQFPGNISVVKSAPQLEILKRASLFVTHSGMNSTSEAIHFGGIKPDIT